MKRRSYFLTFDGGCATCNTLATAIEEEARGKVVALSNTSEQAKDLLSRAFPSGYEAQPYLIAVKGSKVRAATGIKMAMTLGRVLGPTRGVRVYNLAHRLGVTFRLENGKLSIEKGVGRATFLKQGAMLAGALGLLPLLGSKPMSTLAAQPTPTNPLSLQVLPQTEMIALVGKVKASSAFSRFVSQLPSGYSPIRGALAMGVGSGQAAVCISITYPGVATPTAFVAILERSTKAIFQTYAVRGGDTAAGHRIQLSTGDQPTVDVTVNDQGIVIDNNGRIASASTSSLVNGQNLITQFAQSLDAAAAPAGTIQPDVNWSCMTSCLEKLGVPAFLAGAVGAVCGVVCAATLGIGCMACLAAVLDAYAAMGSLCLAKCSSPWYCPWC